MKASCRPCVSWHPAQSLGRALRVGERPLHHLAHLQCVPRRSPAAAGRIFTLGVSVFPGAWLPRRRSAVHRRRPRWTVGTWSRSSRGRSLGAGAGFICRGRSVCRGCNLEKEGDIPRASGLPLGTGAPKPDVATDRWPAAPEGGPSEPVQVNPAAAGVVSPAGAAVVDAQAGGRGGGAFASARRRRAVAPSEARCSSRSLPWLAARPP